ELLGEFPKTEPDFEALALAIEAKLKASSTAGALSDDDLFKAPELAPEAGEPGTPSSVRPTAPKSNFAEMARKSVQKQDDDAAALAKELLAAAAQSRRPDAEMVERVRAAGRAASATTSPLPTGERTSGVALRVDTAVTATTVPPSAPA